MVGQPARSAQIARWVDEQLVGRDEIVDEMVAIADDAARGLGSIVILSGEAGIGKTSVARVVARHVHERMGVSWGACTADRSTPPFWPWHSLVTLEHANRLATDPTVGAPRFEQLRALREQVCERVVGAPHLHVIEDVQWADVASVLLLGHVGVAIGATPLLVIATMRTEEPLPHPLDTAIEDVRRASTVRQLAPLRHEDIATLARRAGTVAEDHLIDLLASRTGGNPLFVTELLRAVATTGAPDRRLATLAESVPDRVTDLIVSRLERLPGVVSDMLLTAAVLGAEGTTSSLAAVHGADAGAIGEL
ncbi:MAG: AAA family ATPase, partial [Ilumatobacteraceae bacterium]